MEQSVDSQPDLLTLLRPAGVEESELESILVQHFGSASTEGNVTVYPKDSATYALKLHYDGDRLTEITSGPALTPAMLNNLRDRIHAEIVQSTGAFVGSSILFSRLPVKGWWRYRDMFQILPVPQHAPTPQSILGEHPLVLQFTFHRSTDILINNLRRALVTKRLCLLLHVLVEGSFVERSQTVRHHWIWVPDHLRKDKDQEYAFCQEGYGFNGFQAELSTFSSMEGTPLLRSVDPKQYYERFAISTDQTLEIPSNLEEVLDRFFALPQDTQERFLRACYWLRYSHTVWHDSRSASYVALVQAIEALLPDRKSAACNQCGRPLEGTTESFHEFLERFAPQAGSVARSRKRLYAIRSKVSHGGSLFRNDLMSLLWGLNPQYIDEMNVAREMRLTARIALVNWLYAQSGK